MLKSNYKQTSDFKVKTQPHFKIQNVLIYPGRFQPPHFGHFETVMNVLSNNKNFLKNKDDYDLLYDVDKLFIVIAPLPPEGYNEKNFIGGYERKRLWEIGLNEIRYKYGLNTTKIEILVAESSTSLLWYVKFLAEISTAYNILGVLTANPKTEVIGTQNHVRIIPTIRPQQPKFKGTRIRDLIIHNQKEQLKELMPLNILNYLYDKQSQFSMVDRLKSIINET